MKSQTARLQFLMNVDRVVHGTIPRTGDRTGCVEWGAEERRVSERAADNEDQIRAGKRSQITATKAPPRMPHPDSSLIARRICVMPGKYVASPSYIATHGAPKTPDDLPSHEALLQGTVIWRFVNAGKPVLRRPRGRFKADNGDALLAAALVGLGVAALPDLMVAPHVASGALAHVLTDYPPPDAGLYVVRPPGDLPPRKVRALTDILLEYFGAGHSRAAS